MEIWAIEAFGSAYNLQELITIKSDDSKNRKTMLKNIIEGKKLPIPYTPQSFITLITEIQCLCLKIKIYKNK